MGQKDAALPHHQGHRYSGRGVPESWMHARRVRNIDVCHVEDRNQVIITKHGRGAAVIIDFGECEEYEKFLHEKYVERKLTESLREAQDPDTKWLTRQEFWEKVDKGL